MIEYTKNQVNKAIQSFNTNALEKMVLNISEYFYNKIKEYIPAILRFDDDFVEKFISNTGIIHISPYTDKKVDVISIHKNNEHFTCSFTYRKDGESFVKINQFGWKTEDFINEQKWIDNINDALSFYKSIVKSRIEKYEEIMSRLPQTDFTIEDFKDK